MLTKRQFYIHRPAFFSRFSLELTKNLFWLISHFNAEHFGKWLHPCQTEDYFSTRIWLYLCLVLFYLPLSLSLSLSHSLSQSILTLLPERKWARSMTERLRKCLCVLRSRESRCFAGCSTIERPFAEHGFESLLGIAIMMQRHCHLSEKEWGVHSTLISTDESNRIKE